MCVTLGRVIRRYRCTAVTFELYQELINSGKLGRLKQIKRKRKKKILL